MCQKSFNYYRENARKNLCFLQDRSKWKNEKAWDSSRSHSNDKVNCHSTRVNRHDTEHPVKKASEMATHDHPTLVTFTSRSAAEQNVDHVALKRWKEGIESDPMGERRESYPASLVLCASLCPHPWFKKLTRPDMGRLTQFAATDTQASTIRTPSHAAELPAPHALTLIGPGVSTATSISSRGPPNMKKSAPPSRASSPA